MSTNNQSDKNRSQWAWVIYQLTLQGTNLAAIARKIGVTRQAICMAAKHHRPRIEMEIAERIGVLPCHIWPDRYPDCPTKCTHHSGQNEVVQ